MGATGLRLSVERLDDQTVVVHEPPTPWHDDTSSTRRWSRWSCPTARCATPTGPSPPARSLLEGHVTELDVRAGGAAGGAAPLTLRVTLHDDVWLPALLTNRSLSSALLAGLAPVGERSEASGWLVARPADAAR